jgi:tripartite-type tricarboxylate transporter receptor subunit TctC
MRQIIAGVMLFLALMTQVFAQAYPTRPIRLTVSYAAGGQTDIIARIVAVKMSEGLGQTIIVDNKPGGSGNIGTAFVAKAAPDGYNVLFGTSGPLAINVAMTEKLPFDALRDFVPVGMVSYAPAVLVVPAQSGINSVAELLTAIRAAKQALAFSSAGNGSTPHLAGELFKQMAKVDLQHIPYKGDSPALTDLLGGQVQLSFPGLASAMPYIKAGRLKALAVTSPQRSAAMPNVPTMREAGISQYDLMGWFGLFVPVGTPPEISATLARELRVALADPKIRQRLIEFGVEAADPMSAQQMSTFHQSQIKRYTEVVRSGNIKAD